ncbi:MAG TPA: hypothetical protein VNG53_06100 [Bacteroidia bacterium]|nr:hypothetical protein [Bacteroidia bacterium]
MTNNPICHPPPLKNSSSTTNDSSSSVFIAYGKYFSMFMKSNQGLFRGLDFGMSPENVVKSEQIEPDENDKDYLFYTIPFDTLAADSNNYFTISYSFDERGMNEIKAEVFLNTDQDAEQLINKITSYYNQKYQKATNEDETSIWTLHDPNYGKIKIALADESAEYGYGKITLSFYNGDY